MLQYVFVNAFPWPLVEDFEEGSVVEMAEHSPLVAGTTFLGTVHHCHSGAILTATVNQSFVPFCARIWYSC